MNGQDVCFCLPNFAGGGAEKVFVTLMRAYSFDSIYETKQKLNLNLGHGSKHTAKSKNSLDTKRSPPLNQISCVVLSAEGPLKSRVPTNCVIHDLHGGSAKRCFFRLIQHFKKTKPSIVFSNLAYLNFVIVLSLILARHRPRRLILREANTPKSTIRSLKIKSLGMLLYKNLYKRADAIICNSRQVNNELRALGVPDDRIKVIPNPININELCELATKQCKLPEFADKSASLIISIGRLTEQKGFDRLIDWFCELQRNANLLIIGDGPDEEKLNKQIKAVNKTKSIKIIGFQENPFSFVKKASAVVLASRWEGLPNIGLEALALGKPVIATLECGGLVELAEEFSVDNLQIIETGVEFAKAVEAVIDDDAARDFSVIAESKLPPKYGIETVMRQYTQIIYG
jgi:glycosyltransferase involved in cell wall biosynthesis